MWLAIFASHSVPGLMPSSYQTLKRSACSPRNNRPDPFRIFVRITYENIGLFAHVCDRSFHKVPQIVKRFVYFAMNSTPSVPGPQWEEMTAPAVVSRISLKWPRLSRYFLTSSTISLSHPE